jgi:hypothetical protein
LANAVLVGAATKAYGISQPETQVKPPEYKLGPSILQGATDATKTQFSIVFDANRALDISVTDSSGRRYQPDAIRETPFQDHPKKITKVFFSNLFPNETFSLFLTDPSSGSLIDAREFRTLELGKASLRFAICSCMDDYMHDPTIWQDVIERTPDMIFFIGDSVYADTGSTKEGATPAHLWKRFCESRTVLEVYYSKKLIPIIATWDDHDFGLDDSNRFNYAYVKESQQNFLQFFAQDESHCTLLQRGPGVSSSLRYGDQLFLFLDGRSFRDKKGSKERYAHWGQEQETWMMDLISKTQGPSWLMTGTQMFPSFIFQESVSKDYPVQFQAVLGQIKTMSSKVIFVSGDVHYSEITQIEPAVLGYPTYELTSSAMHSVGTPGAPGIIPNRRRINGEGSRNYFLVESTVKGSGSSFNTSCFGSLGQPYFTRNLEVV